MTPSKHKQLKEAALEAIRAVHADSSVSVDTRMESLGDISMEVSRLENDLDKDGEP